MEQHASEGRRVPRKPSVTSVWWQSGGPQEQQPSFLSSLPVGKLWFKTMSVQNSFVQQCHLTQIVCFYGLSQLVKVTLTIIGTCDIPQYYCISHSGTVSGLRLESGSVPSLWWSLYDSWLSYETITLESLGVNSDFISMSPWCLMNMWITFIVLINDKALIVCIFQICIRQGKSRSVNLVWPWGMR